MFDVTKIKPQQKGQSDKYSWYLYRFLNKLINKGEGRYIQRQLEIHWLHESRWDGKWLEFNPDKLQKLLLNQVLIVPFGKQHGGSFYHLSSILREGKATEFALLPSWKEKMTDITNWFFDTYEKDGRCIFDREHNGWFSSADNRFTYVNNTRKCNWCGEWHHKEIHKEQTIKRREVWV